MHSLNLYNTTPTKLVTYQYQLLCILHDVCMLLTFHIYIIYMHKLEKTVTNNSVTCEKHLLLKSAHGKFAESKCMALKTR